jgi:hypothetical protein
MLGGCAAPRHAQHPQDDIAARQAKLQAIADQSKPAKKPEAPTQE